MKVGSIFWGSFFVVLGGLFLAKTLGFKAANIDGLTKLWPLILIALGISYLISPEALARVLAAAAGVLGGVIVWMVFQRLDVSSVYLFRANDSEATAKTHLTAPYDGTATRAKCQIEARVGELILSDTTTHLLEVDAPSTLGLYELHQVREGDTEKVEIKVQDAEISLEHKVTHQLHLTLNPNPIWEIRTDVSAAKVDFDLSAFRVQYIGIESGATSVKLKVGLRSDSVRLDLSAAASALKLLVPKDMGCQIVSKNSFTSISANGFTTFDPLTMRTEGFEDAPKKIYIVLKGELSNLNLERY